MTNNSTIALLFLFALTISACGPKENVYTPDRNLFEIELDGRSIKVPRENGVEYSFQNSNSYGTGVINGKTKLSFSTSVVPGFKAVERFDLEIVVQADTTLLTKSTAFGSHFTSESNFRNLFTEGTKEWATDEDTTTGWVFTYTDLNDNEWSTTTSRAGKMKPLQDTINYDNFNLEILEVIEIDDDESPLSFWVTFQFNCEVYNWGGKFLKVENGRFKGRFTRGRTE